MTDFNNMDADARGERRSSPRLIHNGEILVSHPLVGKTTMKVHDFSDRGVFLVGSCASMPGVGSTVKLQMQGLDEPAPVVPAKIVRFEASGVALVFNE